MSAAVLGSSRDAWKPEQPGGFGIGAMAALAAHAVLVAALAIGVNWRSSPTDTAIAAELWSAVPEVAAPKPVEPPPAPPEPPKPAPRPEPDPRLEQQRRDAQIATERAEREKKRREQEEERERAEKAKLEKLKAEKLKEDKLKEEKAKAEERRRAELTAKMREEQLARVRELAGATGTPSSTGTALRDAAPSAGYAGRIRARIKPNLVLVGEVPGNPVVEVELRCAPDGRITGRRVVTPSGNAVWDETVLRAIDRTEVLPRDIDGRVPATIILKYARQE